MSNDRTRSLLAAAALALVSLAGCSPPALAGTNDVSLEYAAVVGGGATPSGPGALSLATAVKARLVAAHLAADVAAIDEGTVRILIDADAAPGVDELLRWRGGLSVYRVDDAFPLLPGDGRDLRPAVATTTGANDRQPVDTGWKGPVDAVERLVHEARLNATHAVFAERLGGESRTRVLVMPPLIGSAATGTEIEEVAIIDRGRALRLVLPPLARARLLTERNAHPDATVAFVWGHTLVATLPMDQALATPAIIRFGDDIGAYARAYRAALFLRSPVLPPMLRVYAARLPARWGLAMACALLPFALSLAWLSFVRRFDRARPEPTWLVVATFALGGAAILPATLAEMGLASLTPWLDPSVATLGGQRWALPLSISVFTLTTGAVEEVCKWFAAWALASHRREFDEPVDGIVYACAAALGFAAVENVKYFALGRMSGALIAVRAFMTVPAHMFFASLWGYAMGRRLVSRRTSVVAFLALASVAHGAFDAVLSTEGTQFISTLLVVALALAFMTMLRRALRYGALAPEPRNDLGRRLADGQSGSPEGAVKREYFQVGSPLSFYASATAMLVCAFALTLLGSAYEFLHHRVGAPFVAGASGLLAIFGLAAYAASETIPLDVALDATGVTFAGGRNAWGQILSLRVEGGGRRAFVRMLLAERSVCLGPTSVARARFIARAISARRTTSS